MKKNHKVVVGKEKVKRFKDKNIGPSQTLKV